MSGYEGAYECHLEPVPSIVSLYFAADEVSSDLQRSCMETNSAP